MPKIKVWADLASSEASLLGLQMTAFFPLCTHIPGVSLVFLFCVVKYFIYLFIYLAAPDLSGGTWDLLVAACRIFSCGM